VTSLAELLLVEQLRQAGIPYVREFRAIEGRRFRWDFYLTDDLMVEIDGGGYIGGRHSRGAGMEKDCEKQSLAAISGYRVIRATPRQVNDGTCFTWIKQALGLEERDAA
jgi:very-short-patch-repair endonuclease